MNLRPGQPKTVDTLLNELASSKNSAVRRRAAIALGAAGGIGASEALVDAMRNDPAKTVRATAMEAIAGLGAVAVPYLVRVLLARPTRKNAREREASRHLLANIGAPAVEAVAGGMTHKYRSVRTEAAKAMAAIGEPALPRLLDFLHHNDENVAAYAAHGLAILGPKAVPGLVQVLNGAAEGIPVAWVAGTPLQSPSTAGRRLAAQTLGKIDSLDAETRLRQAWKQDGSYFVREQARLALLDRGVTDLPVRLTRESLVNMLCEAWEAGRLAVEAKTGFDLFGYSIIISYDLLLGRTEFAHQINALSADINSGRYEGRPLPCKVEVYWMDGIGGKSARMDVKCPERPEYWGVYRAEAFDSAFVGVLFRHGIEGWLVGTRLD